MTHPLFRKDMYVETAFAKRFQEMLHDAWDNRAFHLIVADPGAGKTMSIRDLQKRAGSHRSQTIYATRSVSLVECPRLLKNAFALPK